MAAGIPKVDISLLESPPELGNKDGLDLETKIIEVTVDSSKLKIYTENLSRKDAKPKLDVLFLHGASFSSQNWLEIKTLYHVANWGYRAAAVDLPGGKGKSSGSVARERSADFMHNLIKALGFNKPVIVSPSLSGGYALPYLFQDGQTSVDRATGYVPVAPVGTSNFVDQYKKSQLPTLIVCGAKDLGLGAGSTRDLQHLLNAQYAPIEGAGHACYMNDPDAFHKLLFNFLRNISQ